LIALLGIKGREVSDGSDVYDVEDGY